MILAATSGGERVLRSISWPIHRSAWKGCSRNFALRGFSEVRRREAISKRKHHPKERCPLPLYIDTLGSNDPVGSTKEGGTLWIDGSGRWTAGAASTPRFP